MFERRDVGGLAVVLGSASGGRNWVLCCRDWDDLDAYFRWREEHPELAAILPTVVTPGGGRHVYCRLRGPDLFVTFPDGELRASNKCYVVLPPSHHPKGGTYRWVKLPVNLRDFPVLDVEDTGFLPSLPQPRRAVRGRPSDGRTAASHAPSPDITRLQELPCAVREAVLRSLPYGAGERNGKLLYLARSLADIEPAAPATAWVDAVFGWWQAALTVIKTKDWATSWRDFVRAWDMVQIPVSSSLPITLMTEAAVLAGSDPRNRVMAACSALASASETGRFYLAGRLASRVTGIPHRSAAEILKDFVRDGFLSIDKAGRPGRRRRTATVYRLGPCFSSMKGGQK
jgi:hypothetical protein